MQVIVKTKKIGGSLAAFLPKDAVKGMNLKENETLHIEVKKPKKSYFGCMKGKLGEFTEADRLDSRV